MNYYEAVRILGLNSGASKEEIKKSYLNACKMYHPDNIGSDIYLNNYNLCQEAYKFLMDDKNSVTFIPNTPSGTKVYGRSKGYAYDHSAYVKKQKAYKKKAQEKKVRNLNDIIKKSQELQKNKSSLEHVDYKSEDDLLNQIRWLRVAKIIHDTIEADKKKEDK